MSARASGAKRNGSSASRTRAFRDDSCRKIRCLLASRLVVGVRPAAIDEFEVVVDAALQSSVGSIECHALVRAPVEFELTLFMVGRGEQPFGIRLAVVGEDQQGNVG